LPSFLYFFLLQFIKLASFPETPTAIFPCLFKNETIFEFTSPSKTILTASNESLSVILKPSQNLTSIFFSCRSFVICLPPPCTNTTFIPTYFINTISLRTLSKLSSSSIMAPPNLTTTILLKYSLMYGNASNNISALF